MHPQWLRQLDRTPMQPSVHKDGYSPRWFGSLWRLLVCPNSPLPQQPAVPFQPRFLLQELIRTHSPFCLDGPPMEVTSPSATGSLSRGAARTESAIFVHVVTTDSGATANRSCQHRTKLPEVCPLWHSFRFIQCGSFAHLQRFGSGTSSSSPPTSASAKP